MDQQTTGYCIYTFLVAGLIKIKEMAGKRKYSQKGENYSLNQCTNKKCKWEGKDEERKKDRIDIHITKLVCPKCGNDNFFRLL